MPISQKTFIIGDIHGCYKEFLELLKKGAYHPKTHRLILTGDMINRGPDSLKVLEWVKKHQVEVVRGNHEQLFINQNFLPPVLTKLAKDMGKNLEKWLIWLKKLPFYIEEKDFLVVHAGLVPQQDPKDSDPHLLMHIRTWPVKKQSHPPLSPPANIPDFVQPAPTRKQDFLPWHDFYTKKKLVVYGHWAKQGLSLKKNSIGLDTGCVYGGQLSGLLLPERKIIQTPAHKNYMF